mmetsp:Transcript_95318/g.269746  ORF Transcript_95318/g.269746 Transcript_95318/m.269746 type:complete len:209 (+) Transcript_95318:1026-1652(+)
MQGGADAARPPPRPVRLPDRRHQHDGQARLHQCRVRLGQDPRAGGRHGEGEAVPHPPGRPGRHRVGVVRPGLHRGAAGGGPQVRGATNPPGNDAALHQVAPVHHGQGVPRQGRQAEREGLRGAGPDRPPGRAGHGERSGLPQAARQREERQRRQRRQGGRARRPEHRLGGGARESLVDPAGAVEPDVRTQDANRTVTSSWPLKRRCPP